ncbi:uncharacterized protein PAC_16775 [Phialocephala subalpina]|uniref:Calpain catalytic domain-containing protein n=1 Tax=Phialocephala subalpina TaxID=576137 RepID=A0A1L7XPC4_9HELO|nr:uncharacterized protein PAC_16775 [Phialocephala subalpina]
MAAPAQTVSGTAPDIVTGLPASDPAPKNLNIGAINPYALAEVVLGKKLDWSDPKTANLVSDALETNYNELFDPKFNSPIYAGLKLNPNGTTEIAKPAEITFIKNVDRLTPSFSSVKKVSDLEHFGIKDIASSPVQQAWLDKGKLNLVLEAPPSLNKKITNLSMPKSIFDLLSSTAHTGSGTSVAWTPSGYTWKDIGQFFKDSTQYNDPVQGALADCWLISALSAVAWADPYGIVERNRSTGTDDTSHTNAIQFYSQPGGRDAPSALVEATDAVVVDSSNNVLYCRSREGGEIWPDVYEKAFAKWTTQNTTDQPDITTLAYGDAAKACGQLMGKTPYYYDTSSRTPDQLWTIVRANSLSFKTITPMVAWTYGSGSQYSGSNIVANHAYTVLGWAFQGGKEYIVLRNPWGVTEPTGLNTYQGLLSFFDESFWRPINTIGNDGVFALEASAFKLYYAGIGGAK